MPSIAVQQVDALKRQRDRYLEEIKEVTVVRRKEPELQNLKHQMGSLENRLSFSKKDREVTVSFSLLQTTHMYTCTYIPRGKWLGMCLLKTCL